MYTQYDDRLGTYNKVHGLSAIDLGTKHWQTVPMDVERLAISPDDTMLFGVGSAGLVFVRTDNLDISKTLPIQGKDVAVAKVGLAQPTPTIPASCVGDCNGGGSVTIDELIRGVNIALGTSPLSSCPNLDCANTGQVTIDCLIKAVNDALNGCPV